MNKLTIICFSINNWEKRKARKQQFMLHLSRREDIAGVLYVEPAMNLWRLVFRITSELRDPDNRQRWKRALTMRQQPLTDKLSVYTPLTLFPLSARWQKLHDINVRLTAAVLRRRLSACDFRSTVIWLYHPFDYLLLSLFPQRALAVFDWAEEWSVYFTELRDPRREEIRHLEELIIKTVDLVFVCSQRMLSLARPLNPNSFHLLDGTVYEQFQETPPELPDDIKAVPRPIAGYLGTINRRIDLELLTRLSDAYPDVSFVFIGDVHTQYVDIAPLHARKNIYFLQGKDYRQLGSYASCVDVWLLPYRPELTPQSPTKVFDYLATGKPTVSTDLIAVQQFMELFHIAPDRDRFIEMLGIALHEQSEERSRQRKATARENSWEQRASEIAGLLRKGLPS